MRQEKLKTNELIEGKYVEFIALKSGLVLMKNTWGKSATDRTRGYIHNI